MKTSQVIIFLCLFAMAGCEKPKTHKNVVFILVDDYGYNDMSFRNNSFYETPNIDQLASESTVFTEGYANSRVCSPSRASILTGKFTAHHGITDWIGAPTGEDWRKKGRLNRLLPANYIHQLPDADITLAEALKKQGYITFFAGKWHLGKVNVIAKVLLNGKEMGVSWIAPHRLDVTSELKEGENQLEIQVTNQWTKRLIGDEKLPNQTGYDVRRGSPNYEARDVDGRPKKMPEWFRNNEPLPEGPRTTFSAYSFQNPTESCLSGRRV